MPIRPEPIPLFLANVKREGEALYTRFASLNDFPLPFELVWRLAGGALQVYIVPDAGQPMPDLEVYSHGLLAEQVLLPVQHGALAARRC